MRLGKSFAALIVISLFGTQALVGQRSDPVKSVAKDSLNINGSVWMKNPFSERDIPTKATPSKSETDRPIVAENQPATTGQRVDQLGDKASVLELPDVLPARPPFENDLPPQGFASTPQREFHSANQTRKASAEQSVVNGLRNSRPQLSLDEIAAQQQSDWNSAGPLDRLVRNTSATEVIEVSSETDLPVVPVKPVHTDANTRNLTKSVKQRVSVEQTAAPRATTRFPERRVSVLKESTAQVPNVKIQPYQIRQQYDPTQHIRDEARMARESFDPAQCNFQPANNPDLSGCYDEWGNFCNPRRLDWECDCRQFPRRENSAGCGTCKSCRSRLGGGRMIGTGKLRQGLQALACGCRGKCNGRCRLINFKINQSGNCGGASCNQVDCGCNSGIQSEGTLHPLSLDTQTESAAPSQTNPDNFGKPFKAMPNNSQNTANQPRSLFSALKNKQTNPK